MRLISRVNHPRRSCSSLIRAAARASAGFSIPNLRVPIPNSKTCVARIAPFSRFSQMARTQVAPSTRRHGLTHGREADAARAGVDGLLVLDLPPEEADNYERLMRNAGLCAIWLVAPTTPDERIATIVKRGTGFIYYVSREGVTGMQAKVASNLADASVPAGVRRLTTDALGHMAWELQSTQTSELDGGRAYEILDRARGRREVPLEQLKTHALNTAIVTTTGFGDTLLIRDEHRYDMYDLAIEFPPPLVERARNMREVLQFIVRDADFEAVDEFLFQLQRRNDRDEIGVAASLAESAVTNFTGLLLPPLFTSTFGAATMTWEMELSHRVTTVSKTALFSP